MIRPIIAGIDTVAAMPIPIDTRAERTRMPRDNLSDRRFYVYVLFREDGTTPFYVGKGAGNRWLDHLRNPIRGPRRHKDSIISNMLAKGVDVPKQKVAENLTAEEALALEIKLIRLIGRKPNGPLVNETRGGEGVVDPSDETRKRMGASQRGRVHPPEIRAKIAAASSGRVQSEETKQKKSRALLGRKMSEAAVAKLRAASLGRKASPETRAKLSAARKGRPGVRHSPEGRAKISIGLKNLPPEVRARLSAARRERGVSDETRAKIGNANRGHRWSSSQRAAHSARMKGKPKSAETRRRMSNAARHRSPEHLAKIATTKRGKPRSEETKQKIRDTIRKNKTQIYLK
jgi:hypothetical protein